jgi:vacuolar iron transporter family protein
MKESFRAGLGFGLTSGIITTLGLMVGLYSGTYSKIIVISGILIIAIADALSDSLGMHISKEAEFNYSHKQVWEATISTFLAKFIFALTFIVPFLFLAIKEAVIAGIFWGLLLLTGFNIYLIKQKKERSYFSLLEHLALAVIVIIITYLVGKGVALLA